MIFETHAHYDDEAFDLDREELLSSLQGEGIAFVVNVSASIASSKETIELTKKYPFLYGAIGVHPSDTAELDEEKFQWLKEATKQEKIVSFCESSTRKYQC